MKTIVIGTAGHIDHGKTTLIKALTGIDCDRLKEEKERGITTELGFAHYRFGNDLVLGIVDVPGHEKFVRHMVAGAWGIDMVLLVVAADEGVMPQTREHVDICELLGLRRGIVAITKTDIVEAEMVELIREDVESFLQGRLLESSPIIPVSSQTGENIDLLKEAIRKTAAALQERSKEGILELPVDRVFTLRGFGTIITGTCISGSIAVGEEIEIYPSGTQARVKNIQTYHENAGEAMAGQRVALNLQGIERTEIERGAIIGRPDTLIPSRRVDATLKYLKLPFKPIRNNSVLRFHVATTQVEARLILLSKEVIEPGEELFAQFVFNEPVVVLPDDRYVLRGSYAIQTVGGGKVLDIMPARHKRNDEYLDSAYEVLMGENFLDKAEYHLIKGGYEGIKRDRLCVLLGKTDPVVAQALAALERQGKAVSFGKVAVQADKFTDYKRMLRKFVHDFHDRNPLKVGISKEELRTRLPRVEPQVFQAALEYCIREGAIEVEKDKVMLRGMGESRTKEVEAIETAILKRLRDHGFTPPVLKELAAEMHQSEKYIRDVMERLVFEKRIVRVKEDIYFHKDIIEDFKEKATAYLKTYKEMTPSDFKSVIDVSRKYMIPLLEYLDEIKLTIRAGDKRVLRN